MIISAKPTDASLIRQITIGENSFMQVSIYFQIPPGATSLVDLLNANKDLFEIDIKANTVTITFPTQRYTHIIKALELLRNNKYLSDPFY